MKSEITVKTLAEILSILLRSDQQFEEELFNKCKQNEGDLRATSGVLIHVSIQPTKKFIRCYFIKELENVGILREDPRLASMVALLRKMDPSGFGIDNVKLDQDQFSK